MAARPTYSELEQRIEALERTSRDQWLQAAVDASGDAIGILTAGGCHFYQNKAFDSMFGYSVEEISQLRPDILFESKEAATEVFGSILAGKSWHGEVRALAKDGRCFPALLRADVIRNDMGDAVGLIKVFTDISERKLVEDALRESEQKFRMMSEQSLFGIEILQDNQIKYVNQAYCEISGFSRDEIMSWGPRAYLELVHPDDREFVMNQAEKKQSAAPGAVRHYQFRGLDKSRETKWLELYSKTVMYQGRSADLVLFIDITDRKRVERTLQESEGRSRCFAAAAFEALIIHEEGLLLSANDQYCEMFGYELAELLGKDVIQITVAPEAAEFVKKQIDLGVLKPYESIGIKRDGARFPIEVRAREWKYEGRKVRVVAIMDITERKRTEEMLRSYNQRLMILHQIDRDILQARSLRDIVDAVLKHIRRLISCWMASVALYEHETNEIVILASDVDGETTIMPGVRATAPADWVSRVLMGHCLMVEDLGAASEPVSPAARLGLAEGVRSCLTVALVVDDGLIGELVLSSKTPAAFSEEDVIVAGEVANQLAIAIHQSRLKEEIERYASELEERVAQRTVELQHLNEELRAFTYSVSHDLKAPLRGIDGYSRLLQQDYMEKLDDEGKSFLDAIRGATQQMGRLIDDLLAYSRLERRAMRTKKFDPRPLVEMVVAERADEIRSRRVTLGVDIPCAAVTVEAEGLAEALRNLLENALKFTRSAPDPHIEIGGRETENTCILWVRDNGIGFDMQYHDRIFEIFQRLHRAEDYSGTGVGLAIVRKVMQRMGGRAWAESAPGQGATFYLEAPK